MVYGKYWIIGQRLCDKSASPFFSLAGGGSGRDGVGAHAGAGAAVFAGEIEIRQALERLNTLGSVMMIGAHPDDDREVVLAYLSRGRHVRTAYLSLTRGEGGQNLIGPEQGDELGIIRTQELLASRKIEGSEQYFTRAIDFGFSKTADETFKNGSAIRCWPTWCGTSAASGRM